MNNVIEFRSRKDNIVEKKLKRFRQLKIGYFNQNLTSQEEIEFDEIEEWLKIHNI